MSDSMVNKVVNSMFKQFKTLLGRAEKNSKDVAKDRLKLVLSYERTNTSVSPQFLEMVKGEIIKVISNYMEIEEHSLDIKVGRSGTGPELIANIPIRSVKTSGK